MKGETVHLSQLSVCGNSNLDQQPLAFGQYLPMNETPIELAKPGDCGSSKSSTCQTMMLIAGALLILLGLFHLGVWLKFGGTWEGPVSWRKPILFGISTGATVLSIGWIYPKLRSYWYDAWMCGAFSLSMVAEVALISLQKWRGVASHFNHSTTLDSAIENAMTFLILVATVVLIELTRRSFGKILADLDLRIAIRIGMVFLLVSCGIGFAILFHGENQLAANADPEKYGVAGVAKFPHGVAIHAIQILPLFCWMFAKLGVPLTQRIKSIGCVSVAIGLFLIYSIVQTLQGRSRFDMTFSGASLLLLTAVFLLPLIYDVTLALISPKANDHKLT